METEKVFMNLDENLQFSYSTLNNLDLENVDYYVEITRHLQEIYHLYQVLMYTLGCVKNNYILLNTGEVLRSDNAPISESDYIVINAMVNNVISAGRTLVEAMECYINVNFDENDVDYEKFFKCLHDTYDTSFAYRLLTRLRDYSQHGHLPVSQNGDWFGFDLYLICIKPHYKHNAQIKQQLEGYIQEVTDVYGDIPRLGLSMTLAEYIAKLLSVYNCFWICVKSDLSVSYERMKLIVEQYPDNVNCLGDTNNMVFVYNIEDGMAHLFFINENPLTMVDGFASEAQISLENHMNEWHDLRKGMLSIRVVDKERIEIDCLN